MKIELSEIRKWIKIKELDVYFSDNDEDGYIDRGKEACLCDLEEWLDELESSETHRKQNDE